MSAETSASPINDRQIGLGPSRAVNRRRPREENRQGESHPGTPMNPRLVTLYEVLEVRIANLLPKKIPDLTSGRQRDRPASPTRRPTSNCSCRHAHLHEMSTTSAVEPYAIGCHQLVYRMP